MNARDIFPGKVPTMRGQKKGDIINERLEKERKIMIDKAAKKPINMLVDSPDPHGKNCLHFQLFVYNYLNVSLFSILGVGGTTDTANTGRAFFGPKREQFMNLVKVTFNLQ